MTLPPFAQLLEDARRRPKTNGRAHSYAAPGAADAYARAAFAAELQELAAQTEPGRNDRLNEAAFNLSQLVAAGHLDHDATWNALYGTALAIGLEHGETTNTLRSAFTAGTDQPRAIPEREDLPELTVLPRPSEATPEPGEEEGGEEEPPSLRDRFPALDWAALWEADDDEEWIVEPLLPARRLVALFSPPKVGKSLLMLDLAVAISRGEDALGKPARQARVLYVDFENDPRGDVRSRLQAMGRKPDELGELVYLSYPRLAYLDTYIGGLELLAIAEEYGCEVIVIDTISRAVGGEENDNDTWLGFYRHTGLALKAAGKAVIRLDHTGKDATKGMRGGSAKYGDVDAVWAMTPLTEDSLRLECTANRLPIAEKTLVVRRDLDPLRHVVTTKRVGDVLRDEAAHLIGVLDRLDFPYDGDGSGREQAAKALDLAGITYTWARLKEAVRDRKERGPLPGQGALAWTPLDAPRVQAEEGS